MAAGRLAIIGGSSGYRFVEQVKGASTIGCIDTPFGRSHPVHVFNSYGKEILYLSRHGEEGYSISAPFVPYRANIWALKELGVSRIISWSGPGAIHRAIPIGDILVPGDIIDETKRRDYTFFEGLGIGFIRQNPVFCPVLAKSLKKVIEQRQGHCRTHDVYVCTEGPRLETPAEIRKFASYGGSLVGMTLVPEAFLAKELEMCYCPLCYVTNYAEGVVERAFEPGKLFEGLMNEDEKLKVAAAEKALPSIAIDALILSENEDNCKCGQSMERYKRMGLISNDWHTWIKKG